MAARASIIPTDSTMRRSRSRSFNRGRRTAFARHFLPLEELIIQRAIMIITMSALSGRYLLRLPPSNNIHPHISTPLPTAWPSFSKQARRYRPSRWSKGEFHVPCVSRLTLLVEKNSPVRSNNNFSSLGSRRFTNWPIAEESRQFTNRPFAEESWRITNRPWIY